MILEIYAVHDRVGAYFAAPIFLANHGVARRMLVDVVTDMSTQIARHPADYSLYHLGTFDNETGRFDLIVPPTHLCSALQLVPPPPATLPLEGPHQ